MTAPVADLGAQRLLHLESRITGAEGDGLCARWEFGRELLMARDGKGRLPNGYLTGVSEAVGSERRELQYRMQFAERYPTETELCNAIAQFRSWFAVTQHGLATPSLTSTTVPAPAPAPEGTYRTLVADPPWAYGNKSTRGAAEDHYRTLSMDQLTGAAPLPSGVNLADYVDGLVAAESHLYLWVTNGFVREGFDILDAWGFTYKTCLTWVKPQMGMGNYFRSSTEHVLFGVRGGLRTLDRATMNWFEARRAKHSAKPEHFYSLVERSSPGPYLDIFSRSRRLGWDVWGDEA